MIKKHRILFGYIIVIGGQRGDSCELVPNLA